MVAILALKSASAYAQSDDRWQEAAPEAEDLQHGQDISRKSGQGDWLGGARLADTLAGGRVTTQYQAFIYQMVGRADLVGEMQRRGLLSSPPACAPASVFEPALETILARAADHRIVVVNEVHHQARDRVLIHILLEPLREMGFTYLAVEDFEHDPEAYATISWPGQAPGYQSVREPVFADAVRRAIDLGYKLIPHEIDFTNFNEVSADERRQARESGQAQNLVDLVLAKDPDARILVHVGYQHAHESLFSTENSPPIEPMAMRLKTLTGIDPLTIDQTACQTQESADVPGPIGFDDAGNAVISELREGAVDLQVRQPAADGAGRPSWLRNLGRKAVAVPESLRKDLEPIVVEARLVGEPEAATPLDRLYLAQGEDLPLMLRTGTYVVRAQTGAGWGQPMPLVVD